MLYYERHCTLMSIMHYGIPVVSWSLPKLFNYQLFLVLDFRLRFPSIQRFSLASWHINMLLFHILFHATGIMMLWENSENRLGVIPILDATVLERKKKINFLESLGAHVIINISHKLCSVFKGSWLNFGPDLIHFVFYSICTDIIRTVQFQSLS